MWTISSTEQSYLALTDAGCETYSFKHQEESIYKQATKAEPLEDVRVKQHQYHIVWNYWQIYFGTYDFFIKLVCKMKRKAYVQIVITNKIQLTKW